MYDMNPQHLAQKKAAWRPLKPLSKPCSQTIARIEGVLKLASDVAQNKQYNTLTILKWKSNPPFMGSCSPVHRGRRNITFTPLKVIQDKQAQLQKQLLNHKKTYGSCGTLLRMHNTCNIIYYPRFISLSGTKITEGMNRCGIYVKGTYECTVIYCENYTYKKQL